MDTGVDPAAAGLGDRLVDLIDATGAGDIPLETVQPPKSAASSSAIHLSSPSGRTLAVSSKWANPTGEWRVGYKAAWTCWPDDLVARRKTERKRAFDVEHARLVAAAQAALDAFEREKKPETKDEAGRDAHEETRKELKARVKALAELRAAYADDVGPILEAVVWHDGEHWRSVVGGGEGEVVEGEIPLVDDDGQPHVLDLTQLKPMTDFRVERHWATFGTIDLLSYSVNILDDGKLLSLNVCSGTHATVRGSDLEVLVGRPPPAAKPFEEQPETC